MHPAAKTYRYINHPKQILVKIQTEVYLEFKTGNQRLNAIEEHKEMKVTFSHCGQDNVTCWSNLHLE